MEIYRDTSGVATLEHPVTGTLTADISRGSEVISANQAVTSNGSIHTTPIDWSLTEYDGTLTINWKKTGFSRVTYEEVVTPIVPLSVLDAIMDGVEQDDQYDAERIVRRIVEAYTGQSFGKFRGTKQVAGNDSTQLALPNPLISFTTMTDDNFNYDPAGFLIRGEGWFLAQTPGGWYTIKDAPPEDVLDQFSYSGVIVAPGAVKKRDFSYTSVYAITGDWGYVSIPVGVVEAAKILLNEYACQDSSYRDKYLHSMKSADWRIEFNQMAFDGTGNLKADQLLEPYKLSNLVVI